MSDEQVAAVLARGIGKALRGGIDAMTIQAGDGPEIQFTRDDLPRLDAASKALRNTAAAPDRNPPGAFDPPVLPPMAEETPPYRPGPPVTVPDVDAFGGRDYLPAPSLETLADWLMNERHPERLDQAREWRIKFLWKRRGGSRGCQVLGKCTLASGLTKFLAERDFVIWLSAEAHAEATPDQIASTLTHELMHVGYVDDVDPETGELLNRKAVVVAHAFEGWPDELQMYPGAMQPAAMQLPIARLVAVARQLPMEGLE